MDDPRLNTCGCCKTSAAPTPAKIDNRPGLSTIRYRVGTYAGFREAMIEDIARRPELSNWTARSSDDFGITLLEMWAYIGDILTFYQERIANEAFLRTATQRESVLRLAALLDYRPSSGMAATTYLAFTLEKDRQVKVPKGLRAQSVPGQDEKPQKFETAEEIQATASLGKVRVFPAPKRVNPFEAQAARGVLQPPGGQTAATVSPGDDLLFVQPAAFLQKKTVQVETDADGCTTLTWSPPLQAALPRTTRVFKLARVLRLFGHDAPCQYVQTIPDARQSNGVRIKLKERRSKRAYAMWISSLLELDAIYDDLKPGTKLLIQEGGKLVALATVKKVRQGSAQFAPLSATVTCITATKEDNTPLPHRSVDRRKTMVYELAEPEIRFWPYELADKTAAGTKTICVEAGSLTAGDFRAGRVVILADGSGTAEPATVKNAVKVPYDGTECWKIVLQSALADTYDASTVHLYGNVVRATHGETVTNEVLGDGAAAGTFQSFEITKSPITCVPQAGAPNGAASTLQVHVDGVQWDEVRSFYGCDGDARVYTTVYDDEGRATVRFGDGVTGARLPTGRGNVTATYRQGIGRAGNVRANAIKTLLDRPTGLKDVLNLMAAEGGADPETRQKARANAPNTVRTFGRLVSLRDFEDAAREYSGIAKAKAACTWDGGERVVHLTVAGDGGVQITGTTHANLVKDLDSRRDPNRKLIVDPFYRRVYIRLKAAIEVDPAYIAETVQAATVQALRDYFAFDNLDLGQPIHLSDVYGMVQNVAGVKAVDIDCLKYKDDAEGARHGATNDPVQAHLPIYSTELAALESTADIAVSVGIRKL